MNEKNARKPDTCELKVGKLKVNVNLRNEKSKGRN